MFRKPKSQQSDSYFPNATASALALEVFRGVLLSAWIIKIACDPLWQLSRLSPSAYHPISFLYPFGKELAPVLLHPAILLGLWILLLLLGGSSLALRASARRGWVTLGFFAAATLYQTLVRSVGAINHTETTILLPLFMLGYHEVFLSSDEESKSPFHHGLPIVTTAAFVGCAYTFVAANRVFKGGTEVFTNNFITYWILDRAFEASYYSNLGWLFLDRPVLQNLAMISFPLVTMVEAAGLAAFLIPRLRWLWFIAVIAFHAGVLLVMGIAFWEPLLIIGLSFFDLDSNPLTRKLAACKSRKAQSPQEPPAKSSELGGST